jgi:hypothetical protein
MPFKRGLLALLSCGLMSFAVAEPVSGPQFHARVLELYGFEPHTLTSAEISVKSARLDEFWSMVKADPKNTLPLLRKELEEASGLAFFSYDGSKLLLSLSQDRSDQRLALRAIPRADLRSVEHTDYLLTVHWLATRGLDTRDAAYRILAFPTFKAFIPQHVLTLGQNYSFIYMLFPMEEASFVDDLASRLGTERNVESQKSLALALWYTALPSAHAALKRFADDRNNPADAAKYARVLIENTASRRSPGAASAQSLRDERRNVMRRPISDEALIEFDELTSKLLGEL